MRLLRDALVSILGFTLFVCLMLVLLPVVLIATPFFILGRIRYYLSFRGRQGFRVRLGWGKGVPELARRLDVPADELIRFEPRYRRITIPKRRGGQRELHAPSAGTKEIQRRVLRRLLAKLKSHEAAHGFERARSTVTNATPHAGKRVIIKLDVVDFFPSTTAERIEKYFRRIGWNKQAAAVLTKITTLDGGLPQGAPTSPRLSNLVNYRFDLQMTKRAGFRKASYTRYADDITFSMNDDYSRYILGLIQYTRRSLKAHGYEMHRQKKLVVRRQHSQQLVTGLVVNQRVRLPRAKRRWLRAVRHRLATTGECTLSPDQLQGWAAYESMVDRAE